MQVIDQINGSALFAQSAYSAAVATKDDLGRDITATYLTSHQSLDGYATQDWVSEQGYITGVDLGNYYTKNETSGADELANAFSQIGPGGDEEVNSFVYDNSATINDVNTSYQTNSGDFLTAAPADMATTGDLADLANSISDTYQVKGDYLTTADSDNFYPSNNPSGFITGVDLTPYYTTAEANTLSSMFSGAIDYVSSNAGDEFPISADEAIQYVQTNSATIDEVNTSYQTNSSTFLTAHQSLEGYATEDWVTAQGYITGVDLSEYAKTSSVLDYIDSACSSKLDTTSFSNVSGDFLTTSFGISESAHWEEATNAYEQASGTYLTSHQDLSDYQTIAGMTAYQPVGDYYSASNPSGFITGVDLTPYATTAEVDTLSSILSGAIDYVSANAGVEFPASANEAITAYQNNSATYLTSHQDLSDYQTTAGMVNYYTTAEANTLSSMLSGAIDYVSANAGGGGGGGSYVSPSGSIWISADNIESTDSAYIPSHPEDILLTATTSWSSMNGYATLNNTNKVYFTSQAARASAFDNEGTFLNSSYNSTALAETEYPPIKLYTNTWVSVKYSAYSAGIMDAYVVELARKNEVNSALNKKLDGSAFTGYYPSNNPSGFAKASDAVMTSSLNLFDGRIARINNQSFIGCDSAYNYTFVGSSASTATKTASAYVGTGHQGVTIQVSARTSISNINWTAFGEDGSNLSAGQVALPNLTRVNSFSFNSPLAENISGVKLYGNSWPTTTAYSAYTSDVKQLASQDNITYLSGAIDYVSANAQPSLSSLNDAGVNNIIVTATLPVTPDANTLYFIPET